MVMLTRTLLHYTGEMETNFPMTTERKKTYNAKVVWSSVVRLHAKGNFKWRTACDEFKIWLNHFQTQLKVTPNKTRDG
jgi:hypothetical protein